MFNIFVITYILDNGINAVKEITDEEIQDFIKEKKEYEESLKGTNKKPIMSIDFQVEIIKAAREICKKDRNEILSIIKKELKNIQ
jgi:hypothetical protein